MGEFATGLRRRSVRVFVATLGFFLLTHGGHFYSVDNDVVFLTAYAIVENGSIAIQPGLVSTTGRGGKNYGVFPIGLSLLEVPFIAAASLIKTRYPSDFETMFGLDLQTFAASLVGPLFGALGAAGFWMIAELLGYPLRVVTWLTIILVASTQFWPAARDGFPHIVVAGCLLLAVARAMTWRDARFIATPITVGSISGLLVLVRPFDAFLTLPPLTIYLVWQDWQRVWGERRFLNSNLGRFLVPVVISIALVGIHNAVRFGNPMSFNESGGFGLPLLVGLHGLLVSVRRGVVFFSPPVLATIPGLIMLRRRRPAEGLLFAALVAVYFLGYATYMHWHGDLCWGPRFIVPTVPFAVLPLGELLTVGGVAEALVLALGFAGLLVQIAGTMVDFRYATAPDFYSDPSYSQIVAHWQALLAGKYLDWLPVHLYVERGVATAIKYAALPLMMMTWGTISLARLLRSAAGTGSNATDSQS